MKHFKTTLKTLKALQSFGITFGDICRIVDFDELMKLADKLNLAWLKLVVTVARSLCALAPAKQQVIIEVIEGLDIDQMT